MREKTIIIMGTGNSVVQCDFKADEIWGVNGAYRVKEQMPPELAQKHFRIDKLFLFDTLFSPEGRLNFDIDSMNDLIKEYGCQLISLRDMKLGKHKLNCSLYPYKKVAGRFDTNYFTDTITYMIAYALYKNTYLARNPAGVVRLELARPLNLRLFGVDMVTTIEYRSSKGGVEFWLGIARGLGCEVSVSKGSAILSNPRPAPYGFPAKYNIKEIDPYGVLDGKAD